MRVIMLSWEYPPELVGGLSPHVHHLSRTLAAGGLPVDVITRAAQGCPSRERHGNLTVRRVEPYFSSAPDFTAWVMHLNFALIEEGVRALCEYEDSLLVPIVHAHDWLVAYAARALKNSFRLPLVATVHATEHGRMNGIHNRGQQYINDVEWWLTYDAWRLICCSRYMQRELEGLFAVPADKVRVIPNGIEPPAPGGGPAGARSTYAGPDERLVVHVGRLVPEKGAGVLLEALPTVLRHHPKVRLVIAGSGPWEGELRQRARNLGLQERVTFAGHLPAEAVQALYRAADVAVVPSTYEPFGIVALEAMAAGAPLVVSDVGGLAEIVEHGIDGLKALPGHPESLALQITTLLADARLTRRLVRAAAEKVRRRYLWEGVAASTLRTYREVLQEYLASPWGRTAVRWQAADQTARRPQAVGQLEGAGRA